MTCFMHLFSPSWSFTLLIYMPIGIATGIVQMMMTADLDDSVSLQICKINMALWIIPPLLYYILQLR